jgi:hypothetical protein
VWALRELLVRLHGGRKGKAPAAADPRWLALAMRARSEATRGMAELLRRLE